MKVFEIEFKDFASEPSLRFDFDYLSFFTKIFQDDFYTFKDLFSILLPEKVDSKKLEDDFLYAEIGDVDSNGDVYSNLLNLYDRDDLLDNYYKKIENGDIFLPASNTILLSKVRPYLKKIVHINSENKTYFTIAFLQILPRSNSKLFFYLLHSVYIENINAISRQGKGYPTLKESDLLSLKFKKSEIDKIIKNSEKLISQIEPIEQKINELKQNIETEKDIINEVFQEYFNFDLKELTKQKKSLVIETDFKNISEKNDELRFSTRWTKKTSIFENSICVKIKTMPFGKYIKKINNGWSPACTEEGDGIPILGQQNFSFDGKLKIVPEKYAIENVSETECNFFVKRNDFFISRGNTLDLVALASFAQEDITENIIYPDLFIKIDFDECLNKKFMAYLINSFYGRFYFSLVAKGKNQTMVKVSAKEIQEFPIPDITSTEQEKIVQRIDSKINEQKTKQNEIQNLRCEIDRIVEKCIFDKES